MKSLSGLKYVFLVILLPFLNQIGAQNYAINFDGTDDYVAVPSTVFSNGVENFTIEFWVKADAGTLAAGSGYMGCIGYEASTGGSSTRNPSIWLKEGEIHIDIIQYNTTTRFDQLTSGLGMVSDKWYHIAYVKSSTNQKVYLNGKVIINATAPQYANCNGNYKIGATNNFLNGSLDNVRFWSVARTQAQITDYMHRDPHVNETGLIAMYNFDAGTGTTLDDIRTSSTTYNGTLTNGPTWVAGSLGDFDNNSVDFDGVDDFGLGDITIDNTSTGGMSVDFWVKLNSKNKQQNFLALRDNLSGAQPRIVPYVNSSNELCCFNSDASGTSSSVVTRLIMTTGVWYHIACVNDGGNVDVYWYCRDSMGKTSATSQPYWNFDGAEILSIGADYQSSSSGDFEVDGEMDNIRIWSSALSNSNVQSLRFNPLENNAQYLEAFYTFDYGASGSTNTTVNHVFYDRVKGNNLTTYNMSFSGSSSNLLTQDSIVPYPVHWFGYSDNLLTNSANTSEGVSVQSGASLLMVAGTFNYPPKLSKNTFLNYLAGDFGCTFDLNGYGLDITGPISFGSATLSGNVNSSLTLSRSSYGSEFGFGTGKRMLKTLSISAISQNDQINEGVYLNTNLSLYESLVSTSGILNLFSDDTLTFKSTSSGTAMAFMDENAEINGMVKVESYIPGRRAFRLLSSPVNSVGSIYYNWQGNGTSASGIGTHITGNGQNGTDATQTGNASLFTFDNASQSWGSVTSTNQSTDKIKAGVPYRLMVRGDRTIDLTNQNPTATNTTLYTIGRIKNTDTTISMASGTTSNTDVFVGNPFQAPVDMGELLGSSTTNTNMKTNVMYIWDPTLNTRGAYVTVSLPTGTNSAGSAANQYLMPGQAAFIKTNNNGAASLTFDDAAITDVNRTNTFRTELGFQPLRVQLFQKDSLDNNGPVADGVLIHFNDDYSSDYNLDDATKPGNLDENISVLNDGSYYSIDLRSHPMGEERVQLNINRYRHKEYSLLLDASNIKDVNIQLVDHYKNTVTDILPMSKIRYDYYLDGNTESTAATRFELVLNPKVNSANQIQEAEKFKVYPNPSLGGTINIVGNISKESISMLDVVGRNIEINIKEIAKGHFVINPLTRISSGVYTLKIGKYFQQIVVQ